MNTQAQRAPLTRDREWIWAFLFATLPLPFFLLGRLVSPVFLIALLLTFVCLVVGLTRPLAGFFCYLVSIQFVDFFKRLLLVSGTPSDFEWYGMLALPDLILVAVLVGTILAKDYRGDSSTRKSRVVATLLFVFACWYTVRSIWTEAPLANSLGKWKLVVPYLACFYLGNRLLSSREAILKLLRVLAISVGLAAIYGLFQVVFGLRSFEERWLYEGYTHLEIPTLIYGEGTARAFSFYSDADTFASTLACVGTLLIFSRRAFGKFWWNSWLLLVLMAAALVATVVRAGWVHALLGVGAYLWVRSEARTAQKALVLLLIAGMLVAGGFWAVSSLIDVESPLLARAIVTGTYNSRIIGYQNLFQMGIIAFIVGKGVATMPGSVKDISGSGVDDELLAHDLISDSLYELGWVGLGLLTAIIVRTLMAPRPHYLGEMGPAVGYLVWSVPLIGVLFGGSILVVRPVTTLLWASVGMLCVRDVGE